MLANCTKFDFELLVFVCVCTVYALASPSVFGWSPAMCCFTRPTTLKTKFMTFHLCAVCRLQSFHSCAYVFVPVSLWPKLFEQKMKYKKRGGEAVTWGSNTYTMYNGVHSIPANKRTFRFCIDHAQHSGDRMAIDRINFQRSLDYIDIFPTRRHHLVHNPNCKRLYADECVQIRMRSKQINI